MDYRNQEDHGMGNIPQVSLGYNNPPPHPPSNLIRASAFSKPSSSPKDHSHPGTAWNGSTAAHDFASPTSTANSGGGFNPLAQDLVIQAASTPTAAAAAAAAAAPTTGSNLKLAAAVKYRECLRNHAASIGGHILDGCCEFMPGEADPLKCAACDCHRSFHRKQTEGDATGAGSFYYHHHHHQRRVDRISVPLLLPPPHPTAAPHHVRHHQQQQQQVAQPTNQNYHQKSHFASSAGFPPSPSGVVPGPNSSVAAFGGGGNNSGSGATTESSSEERMDGTGPSTTAPLNIIASKKRFRTKFTLEQKEKMMEFAERLGWRIQRQDDATIEQFCREAGVRRQVLKVWMHNNKHSIKKQQQQQIHQQPQQQQSMGM